MKRIFIMSNMREFGGAEMSIVTLASYFPENILVTFFVENDQHARQIASKRNPRFEVIRTWKGSGFPVLLLNAALVYFKLRKNNPNAILANTHKGGVILSLVCKVWKSKSTTFALYVRDFGWKYLRFVLRNIPNCRVFVPSPAVKEYFPDKDAFEEASEVLLIPNVASESGALASAEEEAKTPVVACLCARMVPWKGLMYLLQAFSSVRKNVPAAKLVIYGEEIDAAYLRHLEKFVQSNQLDASVDFYGFAPDVGSACRKATVIVVPSLSDRPGPETFGRPVIEAWANARPVIAFDTGGPKYLIQDGVDGFLVKEKDSEALADRIGRLLLDPALATSMGRAGQAKLRGEFCGETVSRSVLSALGLPQASARDKGERVQTTAFTNSI